MSHGDIAHYLHSSSLSRLSVHKMSSGISIEGFLLLTSVSECLDLCAFPRMRHVLHQTVSKKTVGDVISSLGIDNDISAVFRHVELSFNMSSDVLTDGISLRTYHLFVISFASEKAYEEPYNCV